MYQNFDFLFLTALACSVDFLSMIFGFSIKFHVDIGGRKKISNFFFEKKSIEKSPKNIFREIFENFPKLFKGLEDSLYKRYKGNPPNP